MGVTAKGPSGVIRVGGRLAGTLGAWSLDSQSGIVTVKAKPGELDPYWLEMPVKHEVRLHLGNGMIWRFRNLRTTLMGDSVEISGERQRGEPEVIQEGPTT